MNAQPNANEFARVRDAYDALAACAVALDEDPAVVSSALASLTVTLLVEVASTGCVAALHEARRFGEMLVELSKSTPATVRATANFLADERPDVTN